MFPEILEELKRNDAPFYGAFLFWADEAYMGWLNGIEKQKSCLVCQKLIITGRNGADALREVITPAPARQSGA